MNNHQNPAEQVIERFGGQSALARLLSRSQSTVQHWAKTGRIPAQWHEPLLDLAREKGIALEPRHFVSTNGPTIEPADGKLGVLLVGLGAVSSTFIAGVEHIRRGMGLPVGSISQMATIRLGKRSDGQYAARARVRTARGPGPARLRRLGPDRRQRVRGRPQVRRAQPPRRPRPDRRLPEVGRADARGLRLGVREADRRATTPSPSTRSSSSSTRSARTCGGSRPSTAATGW